jgi:hypothetical protein
MGNTPQWSQDLTDAGNAFLTGLPVGWTASWHINQVPQWIVVLRGSWSVQSMDGQRLFLCASTALYAPITNTRGVPAL